MAGLAVHTRTRLLGQTPRMDSLPQAPTVLSVVRKCPPPPSRVLLPHSPGTRQTILVARKSLDPSMPGPPVLDRPSQAGSGQSARWMAQCHARAASGRAWDLLTHSSRLHLLGTWAASRPVAAAWSHVRWGEAAPPTPQMCCAGPDSVVKNQINGHMQKP